MRIIFYMCFLFINLCFSFDLKNINNIKADFIQIITTDDNKIEYSGNFIATREYEAYWEYKKPIKKQIFSNKNQAIIYEPNLNQAIIFNNNKIGLVNILNEAKQDGDKIISHANNITFFIYLDSNDMPKKIEYTDTLDNKNEIILSNIKINTNIDDSIFVFNAPKGTDIIYSKSNTF